MLLIKNTEGREELLRQEALALKKVEMKEAETWAKTREDRRGNWKSFSATGPKKKKVKVKHDGLL
jgi:hypothetical protein